MATERPVETVPLTRPAGDPPDPRPHPVHPPVAYLAAAGHVVSAVVVALALADGGGSAARWVLWAGVLALALQLTAMWGGLRDLLTLPQGSLAMDRGQLHGAGMLAVVVALAIGVFYAAVGNAADDVSTGAAIAVLVGNGLALGGALLGRRTAGSPGTDRDRRVHASMRPPAR